MLHLFDYLSKINKKVVDASVFLGREDNYSIYNMLDKDISLLTFKALNNIAPNYLCSKIQMAKNCHSHNTRRAAKNHLQIPSSNTKFGMRTFAYRASKLWNYLPNELLDIKSRHTKRRNNPEQAEQPKNKPEQAEQPKKNPEQAGTTHKRKPIGKYETMKLYMGYSLRNFVTFHRRKHLTNFEISNISQNIISEKKYCYIFLVHSFFSFSTTCPCQCL